MSSMSSITQQIAEETKICRYVIIQRNILAFYSRNLRNTAQVCYCVLAFLKSSSGTLHVRSFLYSCERCYLLHHDSQSHRRRQKKLLRKAHSRARRFKTHLPDIPCKIYKYIKRHKCMISVYVRFESILKCFSPYFSTLK